MRVEIDDIWPDEKFDFATALDHPENPPTDAGDLFYLAEGTLTGRVTFHSEGNVLEFPKTTFVEFARIFLSVIFHLNFSKITTLPHPDSQFTERPAIAFAVSTFGGPAMHFSISLDKSNYTVTIEIGLGPETFIIHNGEKKGPVHPDLYKVVSFTYELLELNMLAGMFYEKAVGYFEERLDHIDGIREHFFMYPFIEGFPDILSGYPRDEDAD